MVIQVLVILLDLTPTVLLKARILFKNGRVLLRSIGLTVYIYARTHYTIWCYQTIKFRAYHKKVLNFVEICDTSIRSLERQPN